MVTSTPAFVTGGVLLTLTITSSVAEHPLAGLKAVRVYVVVAVGFAVVFAVFVAVRFVIGNQLYEIPFAAVIPILAPPTFVKQVIF